MLIVEAADHGFPKQAANVTVYVNVLDTNDNEPVFSPASYDVRISEDALVGTATVDVFADDIDSGKNTFRSCLPWSANNL